MAHGCQVPFIIPSTETQPFLNLNMAQNSTASTDALKSCLVNKAGMLQPVSDYTQFPHDFLHLGISTASSYSQQL
jgi:hypothetical protein